ncbi:MAG: hypothetical protein AAF467_01015 [Actinomycetota bacterium]
MAGPIPEMGFVAVPRSAASIERTWDGVNAVWGSGSHAVAIASHTVPGDAIASMTAMATADVPMARLPGLSGQSIWLAAVAVGIGRAAVEGAISQASTRISAASGRAWSDYPSTQNSVASADIAIECARQGLFALADHTEEQLLAGDPPDRQTNARLHSICDHAFRTVRRSVSDLFTAGSVDALRAGHILEQSLRDIHGFSVQWERYRHLHYAAGKGLLGDDIVDPMY